MKRLLGAGMAGTFVLAERLRCERRFLLPSRSRGRNAEKNLPVPDDLHGGEGRHEGRDRARLPLIWPVTWRRPQRRTSPIRPSRAP